MVASAASGLQLSCRLRLLLSPVPSQAQEKKVLGEKPMLLQATGKNKKLCAVVKILRHEDLFLLRLFTAAFSPAECATRVVLAAAQYLLQSLCHQCWAERFSAPCAGVCCIRQVQLGRRWLWFWLGSWLFWPGSGICAHKVVQMIVNRNSVCINTSVTPKPISSRFI